MPYELSLAPDRDRGGHRYRAELSGDLDPGAVRRLSDWLAHAKLNPDASFLIDLSATTRTTRRARLEMRALLRRHSDLRAERRLSVLERDRPRGRRLSGTTAPAAVTAIVGRALADAASTPLPL